jgi:hypothetical protein
MRRIEIVLDTFFAGDRRKTLELTEAYAVISQNTSIPIPLKLSQIQDKNPQLKDLPVFVHQKNKQTGI